MSLSNKFLGVAGLTLAGAIGYGFIMPDETDITKNPGRDEQISENLSKYAAPAGGALLLGLACVGAAVAGVLSPRRSERKTIRGLTR